MDLSFENENRVSGSEDCEVFMNDVVMNEMVKSKDTPNVQNYKKLKYEIMKKVLKKLHFQKKFWKPHNRLALR
jgi:hypothetical protein